MGRESDSAGGISAGPLANALDLYKIASHQHLHHHLQQLHHLRHHPHWGFPSNLASSPISFMPHLLCFPTDGHQCSVCRWNYRNETRQLVWIEQADRQSPASALPAWACFETSFSSVMSVQMSIQRELVLKQADRWAPPWNRSPVEFQLITVPSCRKPYFVNIYIALKISQIATGFDDPCDNSCVVCIERQQLHNSVYI